jgi:hypothetical protein
LKARILAEESWPKLAANCFLYSICDIRKKREKNSLAARNQDGWGVRLKIIFGIVANGQSLISTPCLIGYL